MKKVSSRTQDRLAALAVVVTALAVAVALAGLTACSGSGLDVRTPFVSVETEAPDPVFEGKGGDAKDCEWDSSGVKLPAGTTFSFSCGSNSTIIQNQGSSEETKIENKPDGSQDVTVKGQPEEPEQPADEQPDQPEDPADEQPDQPADEQPENPAIQEQDDAQVPVVGEAQAEVPQVERTPESEQPVELEPEPERATQSTLESDWIPPAAPNPDRSLDVDVPELPEPPSGAPSALDSNWDAPIPPADSPELPTVDALEPPEPPHVIPLADVIRDAEDGQNAVYCDSSGAHWGDGHKIKFKSGPHPRNPEIVLSAADREALFCEDMKNAVDQAERVLGEALWTELSQTPSGQVRRDVWIELCFRSECASFVEALKATRAGDWPMAAHEIVDSTLIDIDRDRTVRMHRWMRSGVRS